MTWFASFLMRIRNLTILLVLYYFSSFRVKPSSSIISQESAPQVHVDGRNLAYFRLFGFVGIHHDPAFHWFEIVLIGILAFLSSALLWATITILILHFVFGINRLETSLLRRRG